MTSDILPLLARASAIVSVVILLILALRALLQRIFGAQLTYLAWGALPLALLMALLPTLRTSHPMILVVTPLQQLAHLSAPQLRTGMAQGAQWPHWLVLAWLAGSVATLLWFWHDHLRYRYSLGPLRREGDVLRCTTTQEGPAVVGLWRPAIIVPSDFSKRYTTQEQQLILAHETVHAQRRDPVLNCLCALIQCLFWFHPLVHLGARRFRLDQELACDAVVMQRHPGLRRSYAEAMLKTQLSTQTSLIHCHWQSNHPLKERIMHLQHTSPPAVHKLIGRVLVSAMIAMCGYVSMAAHAGVDAATAPALYQVDLKMKTGDDSSTPSIRTAAGEPFSLVNTGKNGTWRTEFVLDKVGDQTVALKLVVKHDERVVGKPTVQVQLGKEAIVAIKDGTPADLLELRLTVAEAKP
jgi:bla regulator protein BlaR1